MTAIEAISNSPMDRRRFLRCGIGAATLGVAAGSPAVSKEKPVPLRDRICLFTDHLDDHGFTYAEIAVHLKQLGMAGPDLTVRPGGVVPPERVAEELPKVAAALRIPG